MVQEGPIVIDMTGITTEFPSLDPGYYEAEVESCKPGIGKDSGQPKLDWRFNITEPEAAAGHKGFYTTSLQHQSLFSLKRLLLALGYDEGTMEGELVFDPAQVVGLPCTLVVIPDEWRGKTRGRVDRVLPAGSSSAVSDQLNPEAEIPF